MNWHFSKGGYLESYNHESDGRSDMESMLFGLIERPSSPLFEAIGAAQEISRLFPNEPLILCLSGGLDSICMFHAFRQSGVAFSCVTAIYSNGLNRQESEFAIRICEKFNVPLTLKHLDIGEFYGSGRSRDYSALGKTDDLGYCCHLWLLDGLNGICILAGQPPIPIRDISGIRIGLRYEANSCYSHFAMARNMKLIPSFFLYSPQLLVSFVNTPIFQNAIDKKNGVESDADEFQFKRNLYVQSGFPITEHSTKLSGFENFAEKFPHIPKAKF